MVLVTIPFKDNTDDDYALRQLNRALKSLAAQTSPFFTTLIVLDGGIRPDHKNQFQALKETYPFLIKKVGDGKMGAGAARQVGIDFAFSEKFGQLFTYKYLIFLDSDDMLLPNAIEDLARAAQSSNFDVVVSPIIAETNLIEKSIIPAEKNTTWTHGTIYSTKFLYNNKIRFYEDIQGNEDSAFNLLANTLSRKNRGIIEIPTYLWIYNPASVTRTDPKYFASWATPQYILGISRAILEILGKDSEFDKNLIYSIIELYHKYELCQEKEWFGTPEESLGITNNLKALFGRKEIQELLKEEKAQEAIARNVHGAEWCCEEKICFNEGFDWWVKGWTELKYMEDCE